MSTSSLHSRNTSATAVVSRSQLVASPVPRGSVYNIIADRIIKQLESGVAPWRKPWTAKLPVNLISQKSYRGLNVLTLASQGYPSRFWLTFYQANKLGGRIRKGEHSSPVIYWNLGEEREYTTRDGETRVSKPFLLRYSNVQPVADGKY
jgi:antirestriction protein ArdC